MTDYQQQNSTILHEYFDVAYIYGHGVLSEIQNFCGCLLNRFIKQHHKRTEKVRIANVNRFCMDHRGAETVQPASPFKTADRENNVQETLFP